VETAAVMGARVDLPLLSEVLPDSSVDECVATEEQRFAALLARGRKVLAQFGSGRPLTEADLAYLHQTHGLPPELVTDLLA
jgi:alanyl-tRNA synthetase